MSKGFAERLNRLFDTVHPPGRGPYKSAEVLAALRDRGVTMSAPYLSQLRSGKRTRPSPAACTALAHFFGVQPDYFTNDDYYARIDRDLAWLASTREEDVRRAAVDIAMLSLPDRQQVYTMIERLRDDAPRAMTHAYPAPNNSPNMR